MEDHTINAEAFKLSRHVSGEWIRFTFVETGGGTTHVHLSMLLAPQMLERLELIIGKSAPHPIGAKDLNNSLLMLTGYRVQRRPDGQKTLVLQARSDDGAVAIPIALSREDVQNLMSDLSSF